MPPTLTERLQRHLDIAQAKSTEEALALSSAVQTDLFGELHGLVRDLDGSVHKLTRVVENLVSSSNRTLYASWAIAVLTVALAALTAVLLWRTW